MKNGMHRPLLTPTTLQLCSFVLLLQQEKDADCAQEGIFELREVVLLVSAAFSKIESCYPCRNRGLCEFQGDREPKRVRGRRESRCQRDVRLCIADEECETVSRLTMAIVT